MGMPPAIEIIVDNLDANTVQTGTWKTSSAVNPYQGNSVYCTSGCTFTWQPSLPGTGTYAVYAYWTYHDDRSASVPYRIDHDSGTANVLVNQHDAALTSQWNLLGVYNLTAGVNGTVTVSSENGQASADAVRYVLVTENQIGLGSATLNWLPPTQNDDGTALLDLAGYNIYWGTPGNYSNSVTLNNPGLATYVVENLSPGIYEFVVTAFNTAGVESQYSNSAIKTVQ